MMLILLIVFVPLVLLFLKHYALFGVLVSHDHHLPPGPYIWQLLRNFSMYLNIPHIALKNLSKIYGPLISFRVGGQLIVVASSPNTAREILKTRTLSGRFMPLVYCHIPGVTKASVVMARECDDSWKSLRAIGQGYIFSSKAVESNNMIRKLKVKEMVNYIRTKQLGQSLKIENVVFPTFVNVISNILASRDLVGIDLGGKIDRKVVSFVESVTENSNSLGLSDIYPILKKIDFWSKRKAMNMLHDIQLIWGDIVKERKINMSHGKNTGSSTRDFFDELLIAASDTTTLTTVWLMVEIIKNPETLSRVRDEIANQAMDGDELNESRLSECKYFQACVKETLRLHVPGPFGIPHRANETCIVDNYVIPKDSMVMVNFWAIHLDPNNWEDATSFKPERFLNSKIDYKGFNFEFLPFGAGQRMCPGFNVAVKSVQVMVATLVHFFNWDLPNGMQLTDLDTSPYLRGTLKLAKPLYLIPSVRENIPSV
ncbi:hypothetical protein ACJIZ3_013779 [Penstemon smallii]|uniref:Cytochrome P450 n=1 Tax=Penstemon smallii TaxID=265156 RepID=A0ABD3RL37_9LAMI